MSRLRSRLRSRLAGASAIAMAGLVLALNGAWIAGNLDRVRPVSSGDIAPFYAFAAIGDHGHLAAAAVDSAQLRGKVVMIDFWATWCAPCRETLPILDRLYRRWRGRGLEVLSVNTDSPKKARSMLRSMGAAVPLYFDDNGAAVRFGVTTIPHLVLIDQRGVIRQVHRGIATEAELEAELGPLMNR